MDQEAQIWTKLKEDIHEKCVCYEYVDQADTSLSDFIVNLIQLGRLPEAISTELAGLIGDDYDRYFTQWMFARLEELKNPRTISEVETNNHINNNDADYPNNSNTVHEQEVNTKMMTDDDHSSETAQASEGGDRKPARTSRMFTQALTGLGQHQQRHRPRQRSPASPLLTSSSSYSQLSSPSRERRHRDEYHRSQRRHHSRSRSRSPVRHREHVAYRESKEETVFDRIGRSTSSSAPSTPSVFDRLGTKPVITPSQDQPEKKRCKYWPSCDKGEDCPFFHPDTLCPDFPDCPNKASECMFVHPQTGPKKHPRPVSESTLTEKAIPCRYFPHCTNDQCPYFHPPAVPKFYESFQRYPSYQPYIPPHVNTAPKRIPVPCKNGDQCKRPDCHFLHSKDENPAEIICKFDGACSRPGCFYKHTVQPKIGNSHNKSLIIHPPSSSTINTSATGKSERTFAVADDSQVEKMTLGESADLIKSQPQPQQQQQDVEMD